MKNSVLIVGAGKGLSFHLQNFYSNGYKIGLVAEISIKLDIYRVK